MSVLIKLIGMLAVVLMLNWPSASQADQLDDILSAGEIRIGVKLDTAPWGFTDENGEPTGLDVELAKLLAEDLGVDLELVEVTSPSRIPSIISQKVDILIAVLGSTPERARQVTFSQPYAAAELGVYGPSDMPNPETADDLTGTSIAVNKGSTLDLWLTENAPDANLVRFEDAPSALSAYMAGQVETFAENSVLASETMKSHPDADIERKFLMRQSPAHIGLRHGEPELLRWIDTFLFSNRLNGKLYELQEKWLGFKQENLPHI